MNVRNLTLLCFIFVIVKCQTTDDDPVGTECTTRVDHTNGTCQHIDDCPSAKTGQVAARNLTYCNRRQKLVCCPNRDKALEPPQDIRIQVERISDRKCREYKKATQKEYYGGSLILNKKPAVMIQDKCQHKSVGLIVGGVSTQPSEFPHQAHLGYKPSRVTKWICGGSLVSPDYVLTASHCLNQRATGPVKFVKLGMNRRSQRDEKVFIFDVGETHKYPDYNPRTNENDIALIKIRGKVDFTEFIYPICLPTTQLESPDVIVSGFGATGANHEQTEDLMKVVLNRFTHSECQTRYVNTPINSKTMLCYGSRKERKDTCRGDSGGPVQVSNDHEVRCTYKLVGLVSFGAKDCGIPGFPGIYVNVFNYIDWIEGIVWKDEV